eukprot:s3611_g6.t1
MWSQLSLRRPFFQPNDGGNATRRAARRAQRVARCWRPLRGRTARPGTGPGTRVSNLKSGMVTWCWGNQETS